MMDLKFPDFSSDEELPPPSGITMDQYLELVLTLLQWSGDSEESRKETLKEMVEVPFRL